MSIAEWRQDGAFEETTANGGGGGDAQSRLTMGKADWTCPSRSVRINEREDEKSSGEPPEEKVIQGTQVGESESVGLPDAVSLLGGQSA
jgi:hypothetical protein